MPNTNTVVISEERYDELSSAASITASERGCYGEYDFDYEIFEFEYICNALGTDDWYLED